MKKVLIIDTSILCVYLGVPGKDTCGTDQNKWDKKPDFSRHVEKSTKNLTP